jgi:hypothetical protein
MGYDRGPDIADGLSLIRMSDHDRALARKYMDEGAFIADTILRAQSGVRTMIVNTGKLLSGPRPHPRT